MYKYYKNIGIKGDRCGDVLKVIMDNIWDFFTSTCRNKTQQAGAVYDNPIDYTNEFSCRKDQIFATTIFDTAVFGQTFFGSTFSLREYANFDYKNFCFGFDWMRTYETDSDGDRWRKHVIMYVPKSITSYLYDEYLIGENKHEHDVVYEELPYICFTFNDHIFCSDPNPDDDPQLIFLRSNYTEHYLYKTLKWEEGISYVPRHEGGDRYEAYIESAYPIWVINPFSNINNLDAITYDSTLDNNMSMFISLEDHNFIIGFVDHRDSDLVHYSFISSMPYYRTFPGCDFNADFLVRSDALAYTLGTEHEVGGKARKTFIFSQSYTDDRYSTSRTSPNISIMAVNATADSNVVNDLLFSSDYLYNIQSYINLPMFNNYERTCWVNRFLPKDSDNYFYGGKNGNRIDKNIKVPTLSLNLQTKTYPYVNGGTVVTPSEVPGYKTNNSNYISYNNDFTYHDVMFPTAERNVLNSHIVLLPAILCLRREPINGLEEYSPLCRLDFIVRTNTMYHHNKGVFELNINNSNYLVYTEYGTSYNVGILVSSKLEPAI